MSRAIANLCLFVLVYATTACTYQTQSIMDASEAEKVSEKGPPQLTSEWLEKNREIVVESAVELIKTRHPVVAADFPRIDIISIDLGHMEDISPEAREQFEADTTMLLQDIRDRVVTGNTYGETWNVALKARSFRGSDAPLGYVQITGLPTIVVCFKTVFIVCPGPLGAGGVLLEASLDSVSGEPVTIAGAGYSLNIASTIMLGDSMNPESTGEGPRQRNALVASIVSLVDSLVLHYEEKVASSK